MVNHQEQQLLNLIKKQETAWNMGDARLYSEDFEEEGSFTNIRGDVFFGHAVFEQIHERIFHTFFKGSQVKMDVIRVHLPDPLVAIVDLDVHLTGFPALPPNVVTPTPGDLHTHLLEVFVQKENAWKLVAYHNVDVKYA